MRGANPRLNLLSPHGYNIRVYRTDKPHPIYARLGSGRRSETCRCIQQAGNRRRVRRLSDSRMVLLCQLYPRTGRPKPRARGGVMQVRILPQSSLAFASLNTSGAKMRIMQKYPLILDVCCGGRTFWFNKHDPRALFLDNRVFPKQVIWEKGDQQRLFEVKPDKIMDFRDLELASNTFKLVVFDPPHILKRNGKTGWMGKKYGSLNKETWQDDIRKGFSECFRVLQKEGVLIFKWSEIEIPLRKILELTDEKPLFGHKSGKNSKTHWIAFIKS